MSASERAPFGWSVKPGKAMRTKITQMMPIKRSGGFSLIVALGIFAGAMGYTAVTTSSFAASTSTEQLRYRVRHSVFGDIGTYTNIVQSVGDITTVQTTAHFL